ncbi:M1 family aminopeptidase [Flindersiella endophytica]
MATLTRAEAVERSRILEVLSYTVELDLSGAAAAEQGQFPSTTTIRFRVRADAPRAETFVELKPVTLQAIALNGRALDPAQLNGNRFPLDGLEAENELTVVADMAYSNTGEGLHRFQDPADKKTYLYAMTFLDDAQRMFACFDQPDLKAPFTFKVTVPKEWQVISNASGRAVTPTRWEFEATKPLATYFATIVAGPYHSRYRDHDGIRLGIHCRRSLAEHLDRHADELFTVTQQSFDYYHRIFGVRYPFGDKYDQAWVPEFNAGAMENPGCVTARDEMIFRSAVTEFDRQERAITIAHEMAHMWFGDLVTMRWWDDLWLNESFADYMGERTVAAATRFKGAETAFSVGGKTRAYIADQRPSTHPISADVPDAANALNNFDGISYAKGQSVLRQLVAWLGDDVFLTGLRDHFAGHAYGNAELSDLLASLGEASGRDLSDWAQVWLRQPQVNTLRPITTPDGHQAHHTDHADRTEADGTYLDVHVEQTAPAAYPVLRPHQIGIGLYDRQADRVVRRERFFLEVGASKSTPVPQLRDAIRPDLLLLNDGDLTYAKVRFDPASLANLPDLLPAIEDDTARALLWFTTLDMVRDAEWPASKYVKAVADGVGREPNVAVIGILLRYARQVTARFVAPDNREAVLAILNESCRQLLQTADPASDRQLAAAKELIATTDTNGADRLRAWLNGTNVPPGLTIDADIRWQILLRLAILGRLEAEEIDAEALSDATSEGLKSAARCHAALPSPQAKQQAWNILMTDRTVSNHMLAATAQGFWLPEQAALTEPFVDRYFAEITAATSWRTPWMAQGLARGAYPWHPISQATIEQAERLLATGVEPSVSRVLVDETDDVRRALAARELDQTTTP